VREEGEDDAVPTFAFLDGQLFEDEQATRSAFLLLSFNPYAPLSMHTPRLVQRSSSSTRPERSLSSRKKRRKTRDAFSHRYSYALRPQKSTFVPNPRRSASSTTRRVIATSIPPTPTHLEAKEEEKVSALCRVEEGYLKRKAGWPQLRVHGKATRGRRPVLERKTGSGQ
jgi:hypothetical protein